jgi:pimeloyl-ACP methyl ester carboxylesterase
VASSGSVTALEPADLPAEDESGGWEEYADVVVQAIGDRRGVVVVGHSLGGLRRRSCAFAFPSTSSSSWRRWSRHLGSASRTGGRTARYEETGYDDVLYHDVSPELAAEARRRERNESSKALQEPWPLEAWPDTPTRHLLCRDDRMFPAAWTRRHARERLGIDPDEMNGSHYISLSRPHDFADRLAA